MVTNRVADWCAHEFRVSRHRYLIFCNTASLYPVLTYGRGVTDDHALIERWAESVKMNMAGTELEFHYQRWIVPSLAVVQWAPILGKSMLGSMNDMIIMAQYHLGCGDGSPFELSYQLAKAPMSALGMNSPARVFPALGGCGARHTIRRVSPVVLELGAPSGADASLCDEVRPARGSRRVI